MNTDEFINEAFILMITVNLVAFTDYVSDVEMQYAVGGFTYVAIILLVILYNFYFVLKAFFNTIKLACVKNYRVGNKNYKEFKVKMQEIPIT